MSARVPALPRRASARRWRLVLAGAGLVAVALVGLATSATHFSSGASATEVAVQGPREVSRPSRPSVAPVDRAADLGALTGAVEAIAALPEENVLLDSGSMPALDDGQPAPTYEEYIETEREAHVAGLSEMRQVAPWELGFSSAEDMDAHFRANLDVPPGATVEVFEFEQDGEPMIRVAVLPRSPDQDDS